MLSNAFALAVLSSAGFYVIYKKMPGRAQKLMVKYDLVADVAALIFTYVLFGGTVTALIAAAIVSIVVSMMIHIAKHPDDYVWLNQTLAVVKSLVNDAKNMLNDFLKENIATEEKAVQQ